jgi:hypothetical protein
MRQWHKIAYIEAEQVLQSARLLSSKWTKCYACDMQPHQYCESLVAEKNHTKAVQFIAHALPRYESVVWAAQSLLSYPTTEKQNPLTRAILQWIDDPTDEGRREVMRLAQIAEDNDDDSAMNHLGKAVFFSGGSISLPELPPVLPPANSCNVLSMAAVVQGAHQQADPKAALLRAIDLGDEIASNGLTR